MSKAKLHVACNEYPLLTFARRAGRDDGELGAHLALVVAAGFDGYEPVVRSAAQMRDLAAAAARHQLALRSIYVNTVLHDAVSVEQSVDEVMAAAEVARSVGTQIIVTNPSPIRWGSDEDKDDGQLAIQAAALDRLGGELQQMAMVLAYHNHDVELR